MAKTEIPAWKAGRKAALAAWRETLAPEDRAAMDSAWRASKERSAARRAAGDERTRRIVALVLDGLSTEEIAKSIKTARSTVRDRLARFGIEGAAPGKRRAPAAFIPAATRAAIEALAAERGASVGELLANVLIFAFEENAFHARRLLKSAAKG